MTLLRRLFLVLAPLAWLAACATTPIEPLRVNVATVERLEGASMELRFVATLRVQNPNDAPLQFSGATAELILNGKTIGTGVSDRGSFVPRLGEVFVSVPITVSALGDVRQAIGLYGAPDRKLDTTLRGRLTGSGYNDLSFQWRGELAMPLPKGS